MITQQRRTLKLCDDKIAEDQQENYHTLVPVCYTSAETKYADFFPSDVLYNETFLPLSNAMKSKPQRGAFYIYISFCIYFVLYSDCILHVILL